jgi:Na+/H+ antiporter NhaD/arsenite permease-like protein
MLILVVSAILSGLIDNIPYVTTMTPVVASLAATVPDPGHAQAMWWALAIGAGFGGNMTAVGASANVVMLGIGAREGHPIGFWEFTRKGAVVMALTIAVSAPYLWLRYFVFG